MKRRNFIKTIGLLPLTGLTMKLNALNKLTENLGATEQMPVLFVGHGSPMNAIEENEFSKGWKTMAKTVPAPKAILCISAHWETKGTFVTAMEKPQTIHDFGGFPQSLFDVQYNAPGSSWLAREAKAAVTSTTVGLDTQWGLDHGCWSVLNQMYPIADIPVIQLSLDYTQPPSYHYELAKQLSSLRKKGVLILGSGNIVHNLGRIALKGNDFNAPFGLDWALEASAILNKLIVTGDSKSLTNYQTLGKSVQLAIPTPEHYLPMLYALALKEENEKLSLFNDKPVAGAFTMTSIKIEKE